MTITTISGLGGIQQTQNVSSASTKLQAAISSIVSGQSDNTNVSEASQLQSQTSALKQALTNLAQASSLTDVASGGIQQIQGELTQLQTLAEEASAPDLSATDQQALNEQFGQALSNIDQIASSTQFNGEPLLNGSLSGNNSLSIDTVLGTNSQGDESLSIGNLGSGSLLSGISDLSSPANAQQSLGVINNAISQIGNTAANVGAFEQAVGFASANIDSAVTNQQAASATLSEEDIASNSTQTSQDQVLFDAGIALAAQGNNLSPALLQLVS